MRYDFGKKTKFLAPLETSYLHFRTTNEDGSGDELDVKFFDDENSYVSGITIFFDSNIKYKLPNCIGKKKPFDIENALEVEKLWTIKKLGYRMEVFCNGAKILDLTMSGGTCGKTDYSSWSTTVTRVKFDRNKRNKADTFYYLGTVTRFFCS